MKLSKEQLLKLVESKTFDFILDPLIGNEDDVFKKIENIQCNVILDYYDNKCDVDLNCTFQAHLYDVNDHSIHIQQFNFETYFVVSDQYFEDEYFVYLFDKNTLNLDKIIKEEIYYRLPQDFTKLNNSPFMDEDEFYYREFKKINENTEKEPTNLELLKLKELFDN